MRTLAVLLALLAAGCAEPEPRSFTVDLDAVPPETLLRRLAIPDGFREERSTSQDGIPGLVDGHGLGLGREEGEAREQITIGLLLFGSHEEASDTVQRFTRSPEGETSFAPLEMADEAFFESSTRPAGRMQGGSSAVVGRDGSYAFWVAYDALGVAPQVDAVELARELALILDAPR